MAIQVSDVNGRLIQFLGSTGNAGTSIDLNVVQVTTVFIGTAYPRWMPLFLFLRRFSTGSGAVPTATVSAGTATPTVPVDFKAGAALSGNGPDQVFVALRTLSFYGPGNNFFFAVTAGAVGTCDAELYGVIEGA